MSQFYLASSKWEQVDQNSFTDLHCWLLGASKCFCWKLLGSQNLMLRCITGPILLKMLLNRWLQKFEKLHCTTNKPGCCP
ncbi:hypothetical protein AB3S75_035631 [Citrus x aurantiifolia]